jgi:hypothetical protein
MTGCYTTAWNSISKDAPMNLASYSRRYPLVDHYRSV